MKLLGVLALGCVASGVQAGSTPINIDNFVWNDVNGDCTQDANEPGMSGVVVQRWNDARTQLVDSSTSSPTGDYRVRVVLPTLADTFSPLDATPSDLTDSDINPSGGALGFTNVYSFGSSVISTTSIDAGIETSRLFSNSFE
jgi:hypothetical protein